MNGGVRPATSKEKEPSAADVVDLSTAVEDESFRRMLPINGAPVAATPETMAAAGFGAEGTPAILPPPLLPQPPRAKPAVLRRRRGPTILLARPFVAGAVRWRTGAWF
jgi:hypothetical protein